MEQPDMHAVRPANADETINPNHMIIWLDKHIGKSEECVLLKSYFFMTMDPTSGLFEKNLNKDDIDRSICDERSFHVQLDEVKFMFQAFDNVEKCFEAIEKNLDKRIFFITSGSKGKMIVPSLVANFPEKFVPGYLMYIFCAKMNMVHTEGAGNPTNEWAFNFEDNVIMHNHQDDLLVRLVLDIANYLFTEAERLDKPGQLDDAHQHYRWSKQMFLRYQIMEKKKLMTNKINEIDQRISDIEQRLVCQETSANGGVSQPCP